MERLVAHRRFFADLVTASADVPKDELRLASAFASTPREYSVALDSLLEVRTADFPDSNS